MRRKITQETWEQIKTAYAAGINLREIARKMNIPQGTVRKVHGICRELVQLSSRRLD
jgi:DNA invertase Pin-like site-specific DNA recombinase